MKRGEVGVLFVSLLLIFSTVAFAQEGGETSGDIDESFVDPGTSPDSALYTFDLLWEDFRLALATSHEAEASLEAAYLDERFAEMHAMIQDGEYSEAQEAADSASVLLEDFHEDVQGIAESGGVTYDEFTSSEDTSLHDFIELQDDVIDHSNYAEVVDNELQEAVNAGEIGEEDADTLIGDLREETIEEEAAFSELEEAFVEDVAERSEITTLEVSLEVEEEKEEEGVANTVKEEVSEAKIEELRGDVIELEEKIEQTEEEGEDTTTEGILLENAVLKLQICEAALAHGDYGKAHGQFTAAEHLILNADRFYSDVRYRDVGDEERDRVLEGLPTYENIKEIREKIAEENRRNVEDYERKKDEIIQKYPDRAEGIQQMYEESKKVQEVAEKLEGEYDTQYERLIAEGKSEEEATRIVTERFADEFRKSYGEDYIPPGFIDIDPELEVIPIGRIDKIEGLIAEGKVEAGGGFLEGREYIDPATGYEYEFTKEGYTYTTPVGIGYEEKYPEGFVESAKGYLRGDEVHEYEVETDEGTYEYKYSATGYEVIKPDGSSEEHSYQPGTHEIVGGGKIEQKPTGFVYESESGKSVIWEYNPEYSNYIDSATGKVYVPEVSSHVEHTSYDVASKSYKYSDQAGESWSYKGSGDWESSSGEKYSAPLITVAPVGHESDGRYITPEGTTWTFKEDTWESSSGEKYVPPPNNYYAVRDDGSYVDHKGKVYEAGSTPAYSPGTTTSGTGGYSDPSGKSWSYDSSSGTWGCSTTGETYNPSTGVTTQSGEGSGGGTASTTESGNTYGYYHGEGGSGSGGSYTFGGGYYTKNSEGVYVYNPVGTTSTGEATQVDHYGNTWTHNPDGTWTGSGGTTGAYGGVYYDSSGTSYYGAGGHTGEGSYSGATYSGDTTHTDTGTYSGSGTYTGTYSGGTYTGDSGSTSTTGDTTTSTGGGTTTSTTGGTTTSTGGDTGSYSGGDTGGHTGDSGGGH